MAASSLIDVCRFNPTLGGTTDWIYSSAVTGYQSPAAAGAVNGAQYSYRAESADLSQWEVGVGTYNSSTGVLTRGTVLFNSAGTTAKIGFSAVPQVALVALAEDLGVAGWTAYTPTLAAGSGAFTSASAAGKYRQVGKTVHVQIVVSITTNGTAAGSINTSLPVTPNGWATLNGKEGTVNGKSCGGTANSTTDIQILNYDQTYPGVNGATLIVTGVYESV